MKTFDSLRRRGALAVVGVVAVLALTAGCDNPDSEAVAATTNDSSGLVACGPDDVTLYQSGAGPETDPNFTGSSLFVKAKPEKACYLKGYLTGISFRDASGRALGLETAKDSRPANQILVKGGRQAEIDLRWKVQGSSAGTITPTALTFRLPGAKQDSEVEWKNGPISANAPVNHTPAFAAGN